MVKQFWPLAVLIGLTLLLTAEGPTASAQGAGERTIKLTSGYHAEGLFPGARQVGLSATLDGKGGGKGVLSLNPNVIEGFRSTLLPIEEVKIALEVARDSGQAEKGRQLYHIKGEGLGQLLLDAPMDGQGPYWLIRVDQEGTSQRIPMRERASA